MSLFLRGLQAQQQQQANETTNNFFDDQNGASNNDDDSNDRPFTAILVILLVLISICLLICGVQLGRLFWGHFSRSSERSNDNEPTMLVHDGRIIHLTGPQRRAVLEAILTSKNVTDQDVSRKKKKKRRKRRQDGNVSEEEEDEIMGHVPVIDIPGILSSAADSGKPTPPDDNNNDATLPLDEEEESVDAFGDGIVRIAPETPDTQPCTPDREQGRHGSNEHSRKQALTSVPFSTGSHKGDDHIIDATTATKESLSCPSPKSPLQRRVSPDEQALFRDTPLRSNRDCLDNDDCHWNIERVDSDATPRAPLSLDEDDAQAVGANLILPTLLNGDHDTDQDQKPSAIAPESLTRARDDDRNNVSQPETQEFSPIEHATSFDETLGDLCEFHPPPAVGLSRSYSINRRESFTSTAASEYTYDDDSTTGDNVCPICLSGYKQGDTLIVSQYCTHMFHKDCIFEWLGKHDDCPICRAHMVTDKEVSQAATHLAGRPRIHRVANAQRRRAPTSPGTRRAPSLSMQGHVGLLVAENANHYSHDHARQGDRGQRSNDRNRNHERGRASSG